MNIFENVLITLVISTRWRYSNFMLYVNNIDNCDLHSWTIRNLSRNLPNLQQKFVFFTESNYKNLLISENLNVMNCITPFLYNMSTYSGERTISWFQINFASHVFQLTIYIFVTCFDRNIILLLSIKGNSCYVSI